MIDKPLFGATVFLLLIGLLLSYSLSTYTVVQHGLYRLPLLHKTAGGSYSRNIFYDHNIKIGS